MYRVLVGGFRLLLSCHHRLIVFVLRKALTHLTNIHPPAAVAGGDGDIDRPEGNRSWRRVLSAIKACRRYVRGKLSYKHLYTEMPESPSHAKCSKVEIRSRLGRINIH